MNKLSDKIFNHINLFGEDTSPPPELICAECTYVVENRPVYKYGEVFCCQACKEEWANKLR